VERESRYTCGANGHRGENQQSGAVHGILPADGSYRDARDALEPRGNRLAVQHEPGATSTTSIVVPFPIARRDAYRMVSGFTFVKKKRCFIAQRKNLRSTRMNDTPARAKPVVNFVAERKTLRSARIDCRTPVAR
jgi:hypothetical protein